METKKTKLSLATYIFIGMLLGILTGILLQGHADFAKTFIKPFGTLFLNLIKMIVVPVVLFSIISGVISMQDIGRVGKIGAKTIVYYMITTMFAITLGLVFANLLQVGAGYQISTETLQYEAKAAPSIADTLVNIFPSNAVAPLVNASMLQIIVLALFIGSGILLAGEKGKPFADFVESGMEVFIKIMEFVISLSPIGVFALLTPVIAENGPSVLLPLLKLILICYLVYILHVGIVYSFMVKVVAHISPMRFYKTIFPSTMMAFSSSSSVAALPLNLECTQKLGVKKEVASFVLPLGATINMDGTAIYQGVCAIFIAQIFGIQLEITQQLVIILTATLASIGTAGVPGAGMIMLAMVLQSVGLPVEGIALVAGIDRILDMGRTAVNVTGDSACSVCISMTENELAATNPEDSKKTINS